MRFYKICESSPPYFTWFFPLKARFSSIFAYDWVFRQFSHWGTMETLGRSLSSCFQINFRHQKSLHKNTCYVTLKPIIRSQFVTISALVDTGGPTSFIQNVLAIRLWLRYLSSSSTPADIGIWSVFSLFFGNISLSLVLHPPSLFFASCIISVVSLYSLSSLLIDLQNCLAWLGL